MAAGPYFVVAHLPQAAVDASFVVSGDVQAGLASDPLAIIQSVGTYWLGRVVYMPVWALFMSPAAVGWIVAVRALRHRLEAGTTATGHSCVVTGRRGG